MERPTQPLVELEGVRVERSGRPVLDDVTLAVYAGEFLAVVGHNGAGKSTLLQAMAGLLPVSGGRIARRLGPGAIGYVPQRRGFNDQLPLRVEDVLALRLVRRTSLLRRLRPAERAAIAAALEMVGLTGFERRPFQELSGGEQQRVLLARALAGGARLLLLDEPEAALDLPAQRQLYDLLVRLCHASTLACVVVSHDVGLVSSHAGRMMLLEGRVRALGPTPEVLASQALQELYGPPEGPGPRTGAGDGPPLVLPASGRAG
ncbi:metal ABC transporter ATP-binding protein [Limnochorda pilosa]|uniref:ABC transporter related protein n=1 Tax=Limnochorda pilosa TaxID=1555112 RepID=A0A0K2SHH1_LIMPI|nr:ATP-binding cassette domain-containing protein [Limnochorda pilosa]BAS26540.1 ABC transporter related protein [Limnochorda pilosa]